ncbi:unnamed protein product [Didymodactylos carnosus]|uniref:Uncharacterized protein n=1 Tax=Didymodactylos carnosus TaxID=1234261 RepID=A0A813UV09_9BILA|nr:unnamed protein product [Didymodactylos carnosus]CAF1052369.1 unnamed protein product [Didymodactylos carnosus]CAF3615697.1 unnamed protein product [Didymodactylos carnosus]CAF3819038.1 unnamed protein product [Didymodactylos carnosus]
MSKKTTIKPSTAAGCNKNSVLAAAATTTQASVQKLSVNLETHACLWLDQDVNSTQDNLETQQQLRKIINYMQTFDDLEKCEDYIRQAKNEKIVLIVSGRFGKEIIPRLHDLAQFSACYIYCGNKAANDKWAKAYPKVKGIFVHRDKLICEISTDQVARSKIEDTNVSISIFTRLDNAKDAQQNLQSKKAVFLWFQLFIEVLLRMHHKSSAKTEMIAICKKYYQGNTDEEKLIQEFEQNYKPENSVWWYTKESCLYRILNKALRSQDFDMIFALRFFITDISTQLKKEHNRFIRSTIHREPIIRVYRGQGISTDELNLMKDNIGEFISMNSFLSTSKNRTTALDFVQTISITQDMQRILFEIDIDTRLPTVPFAAIKHLSCYSDENEILIMLGAIFRINKLGFNENHRVWLAVVSLSSEDDYDLNETFVYMKEKIGDETNFDSLGKILIHMGEYEKSYKYYQQLLQESQLTVASSYVGLGASARRIGDYPLALSYYKTALEMRENILPSDHPEVADCYGRIGVVNWKIKDYDKALYNCEKALNIQQKSLHSNHIDIAGTYHTMGVVYDDKGDYNSALKYYNKALQIRLVSLPSNHPDIAGMYNDIGCLYEHTSDYKQALQNYQKSLDMKRKILPPSHPEISRTENNIRNIKDKLK